LKLKNAVGGTRNSRDSQRRIWLHYAQDSKLLLIF
jgi:hypothetical protein